MERPALQVLGCLPACRQVRLNLKLRIQGRSPAEAIVGIIVIDATDAHFLRVERCRLDRESHQMVDGSTARAGLISAGNAAAPAILKRCGE